MSSERSQLLHNGVKSDLRQRANGAASPKTPVADMTNLDELIETFGFGPFQRKLFVLCGMGHFVDAVEIALMSILFPVLKAEWFTVNNTDLASLAAFTNLGMIFGAVVLGSMADQVGRRPIFQFSLAISSLFGYLGAISPNIFWFTVCRFFLGIGYGGNIVVDVTLFAEFLPIKNRGLMLVLMHAFFGLGNLFIVTVAWLVVPTLGWRWLVAISATPAFLMLFARRAIPETPRYLLMSGQHDKAREVLMEVARYNKWEEHQVHNLKHLHLGLSHGRADVASSRLSHSQALGHLFRMPLVGLLVPLALTWFFNSFAGQMFHWIPLHLSETHNDISNAFKSAMLLALGDIMGALVMSTMIECSGRLVYLRGGLLLLTCSVFTLGFLQDVDTILISIPLLYMFKSAVMSVLYTYTPEAFPTQVRTTGFGVCSSLHRLAPTFAPYVLAALLDVSFFAVCVTFASVYFLAAVASVFLPFETHGRKIYDNLEAEEDILTAD